MNNQLFATSGTAVLPKTDTTNLAGGSAYKLSPKQALATIAATGTFGNTFYAQGDAQLKQIIDLANQIDDAEFLAKLTIYAREKASMKDMPMALLLILSRKNPSLARKVFPQVVNNGRVLRTLFQMLRSGAIWPPVQGSKSGLKGMSYALQKEFQNWFNTVGVDTLLAASIGDKPSLRDVLRCARPTPTSPERSVTLRWLAGKECNVASLPHNIAELIRYNAAETEQQQLEIVRNLVGVRWDLLSGAAKGPSVWRYICTLMGHQALRMNLNTLLRHKVFENYEMVSYVAARLGDPNEVARAKQFPYQYLAAYQNAEAEIPYAIKQALHNAAELACGNIPQFTKPIIIGVDVSGSMSSPITGRGNGHVSKMRCIDVAAMFGAAVLRRNPDSVIVPFDDKAHVLKVDPGDTILSIADRLARYGGGGTQCAIPLMVGNGLQRSFGGAVIISDNQSWIGQQPQRNSYYASVYGSQYTPTMQAWQQFRLKNRGAKLCCIDLQPHSTVQAPESADILNVGGWSDQVFNVVHGFVCGDGTTFVREVEATEL